ncbi:MAG TPA: HAD family hydrolase [Anaerolineae bacterium]|nr:HAD family hydrolase [Anaerolineae bacterium]
MIRGVIFDLGNTLMYLDCDYEPLNVSGAQAMVQYLNGRGYPTPESFTQDFLAARNQGRALGNTTNLEYTAEHALTDTLTRHGICYIPDGIIPRAIEKYFELEIAQWHTYHDVRATLEQLKARGLRLAVMSNATDHAFVQRITQQAGIAEFFDPLISSAGISHRKPDPRAFQPILDAWQIPPHEIVMVGDSPSYDILGAHRAGMRAVLIEERWPEPLTPHGEFEDAYWMQPDATIHQLAELPDVLDALNDERA